MYRKMQLLAILCTKLLRIILYRLEIQVPHEFSLLNYKSRNFVSQDKFSIDEKGRVYLKESLDANDMFVILQSKNVASKPAISTESV